MSSSNPSHPLPVSVVILAPNGVDRQAIAARFTAFSEVVIPEHADPITDFAAARNAAINNCTQEWILMVDLDEELEISDHQALQAFLATTDRVGVVPRVDVFHGQVLKHGELKNQAPVRLFPKGSGQYVGQVHEVFQSDLPTARAPLLLTHNAHRSIAAFIESVARYAALAARTEPKNRARILIKLLTFPKLKWLTNLVLKNGWRDGWAGLTYATIMSLHSLWVRVFAWEYQNGGKE